jgi:hypothetical protein
MSFISFPNSASSFGASGLAAAAGQNWAHALVDGVPDEGCVGAFRQGEVRLPHHRVVVDPVHLVVRTGDEAVERDHHLENDSAHCSPIPSRCRPTVRKRRQAAASVSSTDESWCRRVASGHDLPRRGPA